MREAGECYVFDDDCIWHMLTPVAVLEGNQYAYRDTLAFDMLPEGWEPAK
jgi:2OG-Fe dioxygenase